MPTTVTVGLDGTRESRTAAHWAAREALLRNVPLQLVQVREAGLYPTISPRVNEQIEEEQARKIINEAAEELHHSFPGLTTTFLVSSGRPPDILTDLSAHTDLLVLGSRGLGSVAGFVVGSTALATVAHATCPVVLVRAAGDEARRNLSATIGTDQPASVRQRPAVLGLDLGRPCDDLIAFAFQTAFRYSAPLHVLHAWHLPPAFGATPSYPVGLEIAEDLQLEADRVLTETLRPWHDKFGDVALSHGAAQGQTSGVLLEAASDASLVIVGRRIRHSGAGTHLGPVAHAVIHHARAPVAVVAHE